MKFVGEKDIFFYLFIIDKKFKKYLVIFFLNFIIIYVFCIEVFEDLLEIFFSFFIL